MRDVPPDLVVSGINTGPNLAGAWMISGTIGAARMAAFFGVPAIAVSGLEENVPGAVEAATSWVVRFAQSELVRKLDPPEYFAVSIPLIPPSKILGVRVAERSTLQTLKEFSRFENYLKAEELEEGEASDSASTIEVWQEEFNTKEWLSAHYEGRGGDLEPYRSGYVVVVPMIADEHDYRTLRRLKSRSQMLPKWSAKGR
jgi:5'-nucleotidase